LYLEYSQPLKLRGLCDPAALFYWCQSWTGQCVKEKNPLQQHKTSPDRHPLTSRITDSHHSFTDHQIPEFEDRQLTLIVYVYLEPRKTLIVIQLPSVNGSSALRIFCVKTFVVCLVRGLFDFFMCLEGMCSYKGLE